MALYGLLQYRHDLRVIVTSCQHKLLYGIRHVALVFFSGSNLVDLCHLHTLGLLVPNCRNDLIVQGRSHDPYVSIS